MTGYLHYYYAQSLSEFGTPRELPQSRGWILERQIVGTTYRDAIGAYPLFLCQDWLQLHNDLKDIENRLVSLSLVSDPFGDYDPHHLRQCFKDLAIPFKKHFVVDLTIPREKNVSSHHRYYARKSLREVTVDCYNTPMSLLDDWCSLYRNLIVRHRITGLKALSENAFKKQLAVPGIIAFKAQRDDEIVGMQLWYVVNNRAYHHLSAYSDEGYRLRVSYGLMWSALKYFQETGLRWLDLGGGAGLADKEDGLTKFKQGWASDTRTVYFCGRVLNKMLYTQLVEITRTTNTSYFPAYRDGEFTN